MIVALKISLYRTNVFFFTALTKKIHSKASLVCKPSIWQLSIRL